MNAIPVICDRCRATGLAGEDPFAELADLLSFTPVPRRPHANGWTPELQRGFIAALATTGSAPRAARAIGKHAFGAEQLRRAKGGASFAAAWDAALDICRERELAGLAEGLADLAAEQQEEREQRRSAILPREQRLLLAAPDSDSDPASVSGRDSVRPERVEGRRLTPREEDDAELERKRGEYLDGIVRTRNRLTRARRLYLAAICDDPAKRAAWEVLVGPVDWEIAERLGPQADEPFCDDPQPDRTADEHNMRRPDMLMTLEAGLFAEFTGGPDALDELRAAHANQADADLPPEEQAAIAAYRDQLRANGWTEDSQGNLWSPERDE